MKQLKEILEEIDITHREENPHYNRNGEFTCELQKPLCKKCNALSRIWDVNPSRWEYFSQDFRSESKGFTISREGFKLYRNSTVVLIDNSKPQNTAAYREPRRIIIIHNFVPFTFEKQYLHPEILKRVKQLLLLSQLSLSYPLNNERKYGIDKKFFYARWWEKDFPRPHYNPPE